MKSTIVLDGSDSLELEEAQCVEQPMTCASLESLPWWLTEQPQREARPDRGESISRRSAFTAVSLVRSDPAESRVTEALFAG